MTSFLIEKHNQKTFDEKISKLSIKICQNILASINSFSRFCEEYYDDRSSDNIFKEVKTLKAEEQSQAVRNILQNWIDWMYDDGMLTTSVKQYISKIKRFFYHNGLKFHIEDFDESLEYKPSVKEELHELTR
jgi:hypothetical protein